MKKVFITGGTSGLGLALTKEYLQHNYFVGICGRDLTKVPADLTGHKNLQLYECDVKDKKNLEKSINLFYEQALPDGRELKKLDIIIASAGMSVGPKSKVPNFEVARDVVETNLMGVLNTFGPAVKIMLEQKSGHLVAISSVAGMVGLPGAAPYSASKAAVLKLCESYALDLKSFGISVTAIAPGFVDTPLTRKNNHPMPFLMSAEKAGKLMFKAIEKKKAFFIFPWQMNIVMTILSRLPRMIYRKLMGMEKFNYSSK